MDGFAQAQKGKMMSDLISRQAAIDALHMHLMYRMGTDSNKKRLDEWINNLPSAQPERKTGRWTKIHWKAFRCSECNRLSEFCTDFCPNCGSLMLKDGEA